MKRTRTWAAGAGIVAAALLLSGCSGSGGAPSSDTWTVTQGKIAKAMSTPTTITFWTWVPGISPEVAAFEKKYPKIKVDVVNAGQSDAEYTKLQSALDAGKGAPDVAQIEYSELPSFIVTNSLLNLAPLGAGALKSQYSPWAWSAVQDAGKIYGIPQDAGPMTFMYRQDLLSKAGITAAPKTWSQFATDAAAVKKKTGSYLMDLGPTDSAQILGLLQEAGANPFSYNGKKDVRIDLTSAKAKMVADYLTTLIQSGNVAVDASWTNDWYQAYSNGTYAGWAVGAWGPDDLTGTAANTSGSWRAAPLPQWSASDNAGGDWGGSSDAVLKSSKNQIAAYEFVKYLNDNTASATELAMNPKSALFPTKLSVLHSSSFSDQPVAFFGGQQVNKLFSSIAATVKQFGYLPYMDYASTAYNDTVAKAIGNKTDVFTAFKAWQRLLIAYGRQQGFTVN